MVVQKEGQSGIETWMSGIRMTMLNDPGRQLLEDQIQSTGFLFLDDYLDSILAGPKQDPMIELAKTPGRRRIAQGKSKAAASKKDKLQSFKPLDEDYSEKENAVPNPVAPINSFHKTLLQSREEDTTEKEPLFKATAKRPKSPSKKKTKAKAVGKARTFGAPIENEVEHIITDGEEEEGTNARMKVNDNYQSAVTGAREPNAVPEKAEAEPSHDSGMPQPNQPVLSIISEGDDFSSKGEESLKGQASNAHTSQSRTQSNKSNKSNKSSSFLKRIPLDFDMANVMDLDDVTQVTIHNVSSSTSGHSFSTVPLDSPVPSKPSGNDADGESGSTHRAASRESDGDTVMESHPAVEIDLQLTTTGPAPMPTPETHPFRGVGQPSPLRKSMRPAKDTTIHALNAKSSMSTQSSWLIKSREKASENNAKKSIALPPATVPAVKRKSGEMFEIRESHPTEEHTGERLRKISKTVEVSPRLNLLKDHEKMFFDRFHDETQPVDSGEGDIITRLKEQVKGYSARAGKSMGKSLGGAAAEALAEARAAAEAKIAERNATENRTIHIPTAPATQDTQSQNHVGPIFVRQPSKPHAPESKADADRRLSLSELVTENEVRKSNSAFAGIFHAPPKANVLPPTSREGDKEANTSTSTTPPNSPPPSSKPRSPVFRLQPKANPPAAASSKTLQIKEPESARSLQPITSQASNFSTQSTYCDPIFNSQPQSWMPSTQGTEFEDQAPFHIEEDYERKIADNDSDFDGDESWHLDDKFNEAWTPVIPGMKDDSMTWSTAPTRSTRSADTGRLDGSIPASKAKKPSNNEFEAKPTSFSLRTQSTGDERYESAKEDEDMDVDEEEVVPSVRLVTPSTQKIGVLPFFNKATHSPDTQSSGFFSSATRLMSSVLGGSKKGKEPVKSLQLAAAVAKKQHEEAEKKAIRLKEMEARRQQATQKKADEEKVREEKKLEEERRRREKDKDNLTDKKVFRLPGKTLTQMENDASKKREGAKKTTIALGASTKEQREAFASKIGKFIPSSSHAAPSAPGPALKKSAHPSMGHAKSGNVKAVITALESKTTITTAPKDKGKGKEVEHTGKHATKTAQAQMQARYQAQLMAQELAAPTNTEPTDDIELPDIASEYSNSDDEGRSKKFDPPVWAQSPALHAELELQSTMNPDDIFGAIKPLKMEELFRNRTSRFRQRTSSANWAGTDELTAYEEKEYARRMGFK